MRTINNIFNINISKLPAYLIVILLKGSNQLYAQHQHDTNKVKAEKNIYIAMMDTMMDDMYTISPGNTPDTAFLQQMIPHHQAHW